MVGRPTAMRALVTVPAALGGAVLLVSFAAMLTKACEFQWRCTTYEQMHERSMHPQIAMHSKAKCRISMTGLMDMARAGEQGIGLRFTAITWHYGCKQLAASMQGFSADANSKSSASACSPQRAGHLL